MQAGLGLVQHHHGRRPWRQQRSDQQQVAQGAVRQFRCRQGAQQAFLVKLDGKATALQGLDIQACAGEGITDGVLQRLRVAYFANRLQRCGQIAAVVMQHWRARAQLRLTHRRIHIAAKVIIKAPATDTFAQQQHFRRAAQVTHLIEQAVIVGRVLGQYIPGAAVTCPHHRPGTLNQQAGRAVERAGPDTFLFDFRVQFELTAGNRDGHSQRDGIAEILPGKAQAQAFDTLGHDGFNRHFAAVHTPADGFRPGPKGRIQPAFTGQGVDHAALGGFRQQAQGAIQVGLAAAIGPGHQIQPVQGHHQFIDRAVIGHREGFQHVLLASVGTIGVWDPPCR